LQNVWTAEWASGGENSSGKDKTGTGLIKITRCETIDFGITGKDKVGTRARRGKTSDGEARKGGDTRGTT